MLRLSAVPSLMIVGSSLSFAALACTLAIDPTSAGDPAVEGLGILRGLPGLHAHSGRGIGTSVHIDLADCKTPGDSSFQTPQMALYFAGEDDRAPRALANGVTYGKKQAWAGSGNITGVFPDQGPFTVNIVATPVSDGQFAGTGFNGKSEPFSCVAKFQEASFTTDNGSVCNRMYVCTRAKSSATSPSPTTQTSTASAITPTAPLPADPTPTTPSALITENIKNKIDSDASAKTSIISSGLIGSSTTIQTSTIYSSNSSSTTPAKPSGNTTSSNGNRSDANPSPSGTLTMEHKLAIAGIVVGVASVAVAIGNWRYPKARRAIVNRLSKIL